MLIDPWPPETTLLIVAVLQRVVVAGQLDGRNPEASMADVLVRFRAGCGGGA
ncbi:MAG: hypothetical protein K0V04_08635 [Deltaproteobacteria bacterium]|nr:hypothetical protein [Deltaproteobacteria bacterium]